MLRFTFQHIKGLGFRKEIDLWKRGIASWEDYLGTLQLSMFEVDSFHKSLQLSVEAYEKGDTDFFALTLNPVEFYRIALSFPEDVMFLDIETTGLSRYYDHITLIGWSFLNEFNVYYQGLDVSLLRNAFARAKAIVTFNGSLFDVPFIKKEFPDIKIPICHIDLRFFAKRFGYSGGQKKIELEIGFRRSEEVEKISGEIAPVLWHRYKEGDNDALKALIAYNRYDIDGMKSLMDICIEHALAKLKHLNYNAPRFKFADHLSNLFFVDEASKQGVIIKSYKGKTGPNLTLKDLQQFKNLSIIGIDLTGSETRPSGWCHLKYNKAITKRVNSDIDLIEETLKCKPDLISIDSPLSLPTGRLTVFDDDTGRDEFGIMRECERILKKRGVNVYPSLIPSMQRLTLRGIQLANEFRSRGIPVIESYPGAAQDILGIPRKQSSLEFLIKGLSAFGIKGDYENIEVSHDELDAITSAMLGYFFWCGKFEALGNEDEDYLIIPDIEKDFPDWVNKKVIGLSGSLASGKTTGGEYFKSKGYVYGRYSMVIAKLLSDEGKELSRSNLQERGYFINQNMGQRWLCRQLVKEFFHKEKRCVIDGLRFPEDHAFMKERFGPHFKHIHLKSHPGTRKIRYDALDRNDISFEEASKHLVEGEVKKLSKLSDVTIENDSDLNYFKKQLHKYI